MKINKKSTGLAVIAALSAFQMKAAEPKRPNILFAIADDASWKHFGAYGCNWVKTPGFDQVARNGILFNNAYTPNAKSAPSRACLLTGRNSWQLEEAANHNCYFPAKFKTYAEALGENGYFVGSTAKGWGPGVQGEINGIARELAGKPFNEFKLKAPTTGISNNDYARNFEAFLKSKPKDEPFCFWFGSYEPHRGYEYGSGIKIGGKSIDEIDEVPSFWPDVAEIRTDMLDYAFEIEHFDQHLQKILKQLEESGELQNTIVIVTADNGMPFPRIKGQEYEYSNHLPLAIMWPDGIKNPGRVVDDMVNFIDFVPTYLEVAGLNAKKIGMQPVTGESLTDIFYSEKSGQVDPKRDYVLIGKERHDVGRPNDEGYPIRGIFKGDYLYLHNFKPERWPVGNPETGYLNTDSSPTKTYLLNTRRETGDMTYWQWNFGKRVGVELYNVKKDPFCMNNLAKETIYAKLIRSLDKEMTKKLKKQQDPRMFGKGDIFDTYKYANDKVDFYNRYMSGEKIKMGKNFGDDIDLDLKDK